jgi:hypothetical protein
VRARLNVEADPKPGPRRPRPQIRRQERQDARFSRADEARTLLDSIKIIRKTEDEEGAETVGPCTNSGDPAGEPANRANDAGYKT